MNACAPTPLRSTHLYHLVHQIWDKQSSVTLACKEHVVLYVPLIYKMHVSSCDCVRPVVPWSAFRGRQAGVGSGLAPVTHLAREATKSYINVIAARNVSSCVYKYIHIYYRNIRNCCINNPLFFSRLASTYSGNFPNHSSSSSTYAAPCVSSFHLQSTGLFLPSWQYLEKQTMTTPVYLRARQHRW